LGRKKDFFRRRRGFGGGTLFVDSNGERRDAGRGVSKNAPHPNSAWLFYRWLIGQEGQKVLAAAGRTPAHPKVEPVDKTRPQKIYAIDDKDYKEFAKYEKVWKEIFKLR
jgi:ABC-type Fe3+ transport system substrate-binding protein